MRKAVTLASFFALAVSALATMPSLPRKAPELSIKEPSGKETLLSSLKGKVVVVEFLYTTCPHCQHESQMLTKLSKEFGSKDFQALGYALNDNAKMLVPGFVQ